MLEIRGIYFAALHYNRRGKLFVQIKEWDRAINDYVQFRKLYPYIWKPKIELLRDIKGGLYFEFYFDTDIDVLNHEHWNKKSYYLEDCIMVEFIQVFSTIKEFAFHGYNVYSPSELNILLEKFKEQLELLNNITSYIDFFKHVEFTKLLHTLIRKFDNIEAGWKSILNQLIQITKNVMELFVDAISKGQSLLLYGI